MKTENAMQLKGARMTNTTVSELSFWQIMKKMHLTLTLDITAGDSIYPKPRKHEFAKIFESGSFSLLTYPLENVLAEKLETILVRNITTTRPRSQNVSQIRA